MRVLLCTLLWLSVASATPAQAPASSDEQVNAAIAGAVSNSPSVTKQSWDNGDLTADQRFRWLQEQHRQTQLPILIAAMTIALLIVLAFLRTHARQSAEALVNGAGLVLVVFATLYISECAITTEQLTAPMGILGAIAGYIFGSATRKASDNPTPPPKANA